MSLLFKDFDPTSLFLTLCQPRAHLCAHAYKIEEYMILYYCLIKKCHIQLYWRKKLTGKESMRMEPVICFLSPDPRQVHAGMDYHGEPADLWSCGIVLVALLAGNSPGTHPRPSVPSTASGAPRTTSSPPGARSATNLWVRFRLILWPPS